MLAISAYRNEARLIETDGRPAIRGNLTEGARVVVAAKAGITRAGLKEEQETLQEFPFDSIRKTMSVLIRMPTGETALVLLDDNCSTIVTAGREGRRIEDNLLKFIRQALTANVAEVSAILFALLMMGAEPQLTLTPSMILRGNLISDGVPALTLGLAPAEDDIMRRPRAVATRASLPAGSDHALCCADWPWTDGHTGCSTPRLPPGGRWPTPGGSPWPR